MRKKDARLYLLILLFLLPASRAFAEDGYELWLRYTPVSDAALLQHYQMMLPAFTVAGAGPTVDAIERELVMGLGGLLGAQMPVKHAGELQAGLVVGTAASSTFIASLAAALQLDGVGEQGYVIKTIGNATANATDNVTGTRIIVAAQSDVGALYGVFHFLRLMQTGERLDNLNIVATPRIKDRILNHWDNLDRTVERGYAGFSLWDWHKLPDYKDPRYIDYARANASIGINGTVLTNVNANATVLTAPYLKKVAALADVFRPYGMRVYLTARFSAPIEIGGLDTADPLDPDVAAWWQGKIDEIYQLVPDFGGFLVKANSEGQPGPQDYGRSHADGANMLADALASHGGLVMWRAFVYSAEEPEDRAKQAYNEFTVLDGTFRDNVLVQVKNGPIDFQPREPFHPLFGAMPETPLMMEFQITKEYLGQGTHLVYMAPLYKEVLESDTYAKGEGSKVARVIDGTLHGYARTAIAGVSNIGTDRNWCGSIFDCANWYAFGRLAWDHTLASEEIARNWLKMTFTGAPEFVVPALGMMMASWEACVNYMTPLGLHHLMARSHHYGPGPWVEGGRRADWTSVYYHRADSIGVGFDRTETGSDAVGQYFSPIDALWGSRDTVPDKFLLWFHRVGWSEQLASGRTLWDELAFRYQAGVDAVQKMEQTWTTLSPFVDEERYSQVTAFLRIQEQEARWWRDSSLLYFQTFSGMPLPDGIPPAPHSLAYYMSLSFPYAPGI